ncbi:hypothetical protein BraRD5C2_76180 [Bradyrhizobium sp. RD5-C2]|nr:hypothetical protein BraRD5C2_76180 [Bradyrhizobium sp. RD5-C2]
MPELYSAARDGVIANSDKTAAHIAPAAPVRFAGIGGLASSMSRPPTDGTIIAGALRCQDILRMAVDQIRRISSDRKRRVALDFLHHRVGSRLAHARQCQ